MHVAVDVCVAVPHSGQADHADIVHAYVWQTTPVSHGSVTSPMLQPGHWLLSARKQSLAQRVWMTREPMPQEPSHWPMERTHCGTRHCAGVGASVAARVAAKVGADVAFSCWGEFTSIISGCSDGASPMSDKSASSALETISVPASTAFDMSSSWALVATRAIRTTTNFT